MTLDYKCATCEVKSHQGKMLFAAEEGKVSLTANSAHTSLSVCDCVCACVWFKNMPCTVRPWIRYTEPGWHCWHDLVNLMVSVVPYFHIYNKSNTKTKHAICRQKKKKMLLQRSGESLIPFFTTPWKAFPGATVFCFFLWGEIRVSRRPYWSQPRALPRWIKAS